MSASRTSHPESGLKPTSVMSQSAAALLMRQAQLHRHHAAKARRLAVSFTTPEVVSRLEQFAGELDARADALEDRARDLRAALAHARELAGRLHEVVVDREILQAARAANDNALLADELT